MATNNSIVWRSEDVYEAMLHASIVNRPVKIKIEGRVGGSSTPVTVGEDYGFFIIGEVPWNDLTPPRRAYTTIMAEEAGAAALLKGANHLTDAQVAIEGDPSGVVLDKIIINDGEVEAVITDNITVTYPSIITITQLAVVLREGDN